MNPWSGPDPPDRQCYWARAPPWPTGTMAPSAQVFALLARAADDHDLHRLENRCLLVLRLRSLPGQSCAPTATSIVPLHSRTARSSPVPGEFEQSRRRNRARYKPVLATPAALTG